MDEKLYFHLWLRELSLDGKMSSLFAFLSDGALTSFSDFETIADALRRHARIVVKPVDGLGGRGTYVLEKTSERGGFETGEACVAVNVCCRDT